jgi:TolB-like protein/Flp pilus assembly protein TadD
MAEEAIALDPEFPPSYHVLAITHMMDVWFRTTKSPKQSLKRAVELTQKALSLDDSFATAHGFLGFLYTMLRQYDKGIAEGERAVALDPNGAWSHFYLGFALRSAGRYEEAVQVIEKSIRLNPFPPGFYLRTACGAYIGTERYEEAIAAAKKAVTIAPNDFLSHSCLAAAYSLAGREEEARSAAEEVLRINPKFSLEYQAKMIPFKNKRHLERHLNALRKAGLPQTPPLPLPDKPSIAVLPFVNMSGDPEQEYFSDGISESIITGLSKTPGLFVIARNSTFTYKGKPTKVQKVGRELGVHYVLEGSVQRSGDRVRITAQLVDAKSGNHVWAERYDRDLKDIFALQDEITVKIISALDVKLLLGGDEAAPYMRSGTKNLQAYLKYMEAFQYIARGTPDDYALARKLSEEAIASDPEYPSAYIVLAMTHIIDAMLGTSKSPRKSLGIAFKLAQKVLAMDESDARGHVILGNVYGAKREHEKAIAELERAVVLDPNNALGYMFLGSRLAFGGRPQEAIPLLKKSMRLSPVSQNHASMCLFRFGIAYRLMGQQEEALSALKKAANIRPNFWGIQLYLAATYIDLGREEEARAAAAEVRRIFQKFSLERYAKRHAYKDQAEWGRFIEALRKSGLK